MCLFSTNPTLVNGHTSKNTRSPCFLNTVIFLSKESIYLAQLSLRISVWHTGTLSVPVVWHVRKIRLATLASKRQGHSRNSLHVIFVPFSSIIDLYSTSFRPCGFCTQPHHDLVVPLALPRLLRGPDQGPGRKPGHGAKDHRLRPRRLRQVPLQR